MRATFALLLALSVVACAAESAPEAADNASSDLGSGGAGVVGICTSTFGSGLIGANHGRLDGTLTAIVPAGTHECHGDRDHVHLQIRMNGDVYDVAVNVDGVKVAEVDAPVVGGEWSEGWHPNAPLDYAHDLRVHTSSFRSANATSVQRQLATDLANADHVSIFATKYSRGGIHLVHRSRSTQPLDGAIVTYPVGSSTPHYFLFQFPDQSF